MPGLAFAGAGIRSTRAAGMGAAFIALADDPSALTFNPAGITHLSGTQLYGGITALVPSTRYKGPSGESPEAHPRVFFPPYLYSPIRTSNRFPNILGFGAAFWPTERWTSTS